MSKAKTIAPLNVYLPEPRKRSVQELAAAQGMTATAFAARVLTMYQLDPVAFEELFQKLLKARRVPEVTSRNARGFSRTAWEK